MAANARVVAAANSSMAAVVPPTGVNTPTVQATVLVDGSGNLIKTVDNGDGTATLSSSATTTTATVATVNLTGSDQAAVATATTYYGLTVAETAGSTAKIRVYDNASAASGTLLDVITLAPNESRAEYYPNGLRALNGIYIKIVSGAVEGSVRYAA